MESSNAPEAPAKPQPAESDNKNTITSMSPVPDLVTSIPAAMAKPKTNAKAEPSVSPKKALAPSTPKASEAEVCAKSSNTTVIKPQGIQTPPAQNNTAVPKAVPVTTATNEASAKNRVREEKARKKDDKSVDHVLRALNSLNTTEEKLAAMCKKYADIFDEHRKLQLLQKQTEKRCGVLQREKEQLQGEHNKAILTRSRLENLCRELQRQNKAIKDESLLRIREEEEKRKEVAAKFQSTMNEITTMMQQNNDKNIKLRDDNIDMTTKLKSICEQYEIRQQQVDRISKQMQLEQQLNEAKMSKLKMEMASERELLLREKQQLLMELQQYQQRCTEFQTTEVNLRGQITMYNDKYDEFQKALARSNDVFGGFKGEMEKMTKKICKLEKETSSWKQRWERSHAALLEMGTDKQRAEQELATTARQLATLQGLCRTLQGERAAMLAKLKAVSSGVPEVVDVLSGNKPQMCSNGAEKCSAVPKVSSNGSAAHPQAPEKSANDSEAGSNWQEPTAATLQMNQRLVDCVNNIGTQLKFSPNDSQMVAFNDAFSPQPELTEKNADVKQKTATRPACQRLRSPETNSGTKPAAASDNLVAQTKDSPPCAPSCGDSASAGKVCLNVNQKSVIVENSSSPLIQSSANGDCAESSVPPVPNLIPTVVESSVLPVTTSNPTAVENAPTPNQSDSSTRAVEKAPVVNGVNHVNENGSATPEVGNPSQPSTPPSTKSQASPGKTSDSGKKAKEATKKKKK